MKVAQKEAVSLLKEIGVHTADKLTIERLTARMKALPKLVEEEGAKAKTADGKTLLKKIVKAVLEGIKVEVVADGAAAKSSAKPAKSEKPAKGKSKPAKAEDDEEEDEEEESEDEESEEEETDEEESEDEETEDEEEESEDEESEDEEEDEESEDEESEDEEEEEEEEKPAKKKKSDKSDKPSKGDKKSSKSDKSDKPAKKTKPKGKTITGRIREIMEQTSEKKPKTKEAIVDILKKEFPDHEDAKLLKTVTGQVAYFLRDTNKAQKNPMDIRNIPGKGYYLAS